MVRKLNKAISILKKATEVLTFIVTGYAKTKHRLSPRLVVRSGSNSPVDCCVVA